MRTNAVRWTTLTYILLFAIQMFGSIFIFWTSMPSFRQLVLRPGEQAASTPYDSNLVEAVLVEMQAAYWYRLLKVAIPLRGSNVLLPHLFLFLGRLNFIFESAVFAVVIFRHLPELGLDVDVLLMAPRGGLLLFTLFALFCFTLELGRFGVALGETKRP
ncbi:MAG: hypothetical protein WA702_27770 [Bradyrhizobium sp.]|uniref:hypothetical protein n=1 Tax=Bradyrhizobium sp. TaxID=376 RepID=UPI003C79B93F